MNHQIRIATDTATLCIFDLQLLKHRVSDSADWWSLPEEEIIELNQGNIVFVDLGSDGIYKIDISDRVENEGNFVQAKLRCLSGKLFIGAGECVSSGEIEPDENDGLFFDVGAGNYNISVCRVRDSYLKVGIERINEEAVNNFTSPLSLED